MPGPHKRTRSETANHDENSTTPSTASSSSRTTRRQAQAQAQAQGLTVTPPSPPSAPAPSRTLPTTPTPGALHRTTSLFSTSASASASSSTRRTNNSSHNATPFGSYAFGSSSSSMNLGGPGVGMLLRTQSTPSIASTSRVKASFASGSGGSGEGDKGEGPSSGFGLGGGRKYGRGKENVPPAQDGDRDRDQASSRKRLRIGRSSRGRSGSVSSLRSETPSTSGRPSLGPSNSLSRITSRLPSPAPSTCSTAAPPVDSASIATSSVDAIDLVSVVGDDGAEDEMDVDKTPPKPRAKATERKYDALPTPPLSSPTEMTEAVKRMELVRMKSDASVSTTISATSADETRPANPYKHLKSFLRLSSSTADTTLDRVIVGRAHEKQVVKAYLSSKETEVGMYVSGPPGTGKTALVTTMGREMAAQGWNVVEFGCMGLKPADMWKRLAERLGCEASEADISSHLQESRDTLIILDEIDSLLPPSPATVPSATSHLLSKLFALPLLSTESRTIKLVAISNTLDLTIRARLTLPDNRLPQVLPFKAYGSTEMGEIMLLRIASASVDRADETTVKVDSKAVDLLTRKVEAANGDLRNCLGCLTSAVTLAESEWTKKSTGSVLVKVSLPHTIKAFNSHTQQLKAAAGSAASGGIASATGKKVRSVPLQGKMVLVSILVYIARVRAGLPGLPTSSSSSSNSNAGATPVGTPTKSGEWLTTSNLFATYTTLLSHHTSPFPPSHESDYRDLLSNLEVLGLVKLVSVAKKGSKVELCVKEEEVKDALGCTSPTGQSKGQGMADDEVRRVYEREQAKIHSAMAKAERSAAVALLGDE